MNGNDKSQAAAAKKPCWVLLGPTASGKTALSLALARRHPVEIVSVDSMQVYRGMDVGTAKPSPQERREVPHHMIDVVEPEEEFSVGRYCELARQAMEGIWNRGRRPLLVCGSPLYLKALMWGLFEGPGADAALRVRLASDLQRYGVEYMHQRLARVDPEAAGRIKPTDWRRIERALEVYELTGEPISARQSQFAGPPHFPSVGVGLRWPRHSLYWRIDLRVDNMMSAGLLDEARRLAGRLGRQAAQAVGYKELIAHLNGATSLEEAVQRIKRSTRRLAKHQLTWFRHFPATRWIDVPESALAEELLQGCERLFLVLDHLNAFGYD